MALSASIVRKIQGGTPEILRGKMAASSTFYAGGLVVLDGGFVSTPTDAANKLPIGYYNGYGRDTSIGADSLTTAWDETPDVEVIQAKTWVPFSGAAQADAGLVFYVDGDDSVTKTAGSMTYGLFCLAVDVANGLVLLDFRNPVAV